MEKIRNFAHLKTKMQTDTAFMKRFQENPIETLENEVKDPRKDVKVFKLVLYFVGAALLISLLVAALVSMSDPVTTTNSAGKQVTEVRELNQFFVMIGSAAIGALAGLLVPTPD